MSQEFKLVPVKLTEEMLESAGEYRLIVKCCWPGMLAAAPAPPAGGEVAILATVYQFGSLVRTGGVLRSVELDRAHVTRLQAELSKADYTNKILMEQAAELGDLLESLTAERDGLLAEQKDWQKLQKRTEDQFYEALASRDALQSELTKALERIADLERGLKFYADGDHLLLADHDEWDTCSGEPINWLHDNGGTASVEDGSVAKQILNQSAPAAKGGSDEA